MGKENIGKSVGAIIRNGEGKILTQYRLRPPIGMALPTGHVDYGELPEEALRRELLEETGLIIKSPKLVFQALIPRADNRCLKGHDSHEWWVYEVVADGEPRLMEPDKHRFLKFMSPGEMKPFIISGEADPAWFDYIFPALGIMI